MTMLRGVPPEAIEGAGGGGFDPDAYLKKKAQRQPGFNPDAYLQTKLEQASARQPEVGADETFINRTASALPLGRTLVNAMSALALQSARSQGYGNSQVKLTDKAKREMDALGIPYEAESNALGDSMLDSYRQTRDRFDKRTAVGSLQNPKTALAGAGTGLALSLAAPLPKVTVGSGAAGRIASNALTGGAYGGVNALANGRADLTRGEVGKALSETVGAEGLQDVYRNAKDGRVGAALLDLLNSGVVGGTLSGGLLSGAGEVARASGLTAKVAEGLKRFSLDKGRKVLTNGADQLSTRQPVADDAVEEAIRSGAIKPFSTNEATLGRLEKLTEQAGDEYGRVLAELEARGVRGPDARKLADELLSEAARREANSGANKGLANMFADEAANAEALAAGGKTLGLRQAENVKRSLQREAKYGRYEETPANEVKRDLASTYRRANEEAIDAAARANPELAPVADRFVPVKQRLGRLLEAESAAERGAARGATRGASSDFGLKASAAAVAAGQPGLIPAAIASNVVKARLPSAMAAFGMRASDALRTPGAGGRAGQLAELLSNALGPSSSGGLTPQEKALLEAYAAQLQKEKQP